jgi:hypothetical protein
MGNAVRLMRISRHALSISVFILSFATLGLGVAVDALGAGQEVSQDSQALKSQSGSGVAAAVTTDGALIYVAPDEESSVIGQLALGQAIKVSRGTTGGAQRFHKIRFGNKIGYIDDIDITIGGKTKPAPAKRVSTDDAQAPTTPAQEPKNESDKTKKPKKKPAKKASNKPPDPIYFTRFLGFEAGAQDYLEGIVGVPASTTMAVYGLKFTGPDILFKGPIMDINILIHYGAPSYYNALSAIQPNGFILFTDAMLVMPLIQRQNAMIYISGGPLLVYSKIGVVNSNRLMDLESLNLGIDGAAGIGVRTGKIAFKFEAKYYIEKQSYKAFLAAIQTSY